MSSFKPPTPSPEQRKATFLAAIKPLLTPTSFTGAGAVLQLVGHIEDYGTLEVDPQTRMDILTKMRDNAGNHYFRAWVENEGAMEVTREWLKSAYASKGDSPLVETIMPLLHVSTRLVVSAHVLTTHISRYVAIRLMQIIDRLPLTLESLKSSKLGKIIVKLVKEPPAPGELFPQSTTISGFFPRSIASESSLARVALGSSRDDVTACLATVCSVWPCTRHAICSARWPAMTSFSTSVA